MFIRDILTMKGSDVSTVSSQTSVEKAVSLMIERGIGSLVVVDDGRMVGVFTPRDVLRGMHQRGQDFSQVIVGDLMTRNPVVGGPDDTLDYVRGVMTGNSFSHLPVIDGDQLLGIISFHDVAKACLNAASFENALLKRYIRNWPEEEEEESTG